MKKYGAVICVLVLLCTAAGMFLSSADSGSIYLTELEPKTYQVDGEIHTDKTYLGLAITVGGKEYGHGISVHPLADGPAEVVYDIEGLGYRTFYAVGGKDKTAGAAVGGDDGIKDTAISMEVWADGVKKAESGVLKYPETYTFQVDIAGAKELKLVGTDGGDGIYCDATSWANAVLSKQAVSEEITFPEETNSTPGPTVLATPDPALKDQEKIFISDMDWITSSIYENGEVGDYAHRDENVAGEELWINGVYFEKGVCLHAVPAGEAYIDINIEGLGFTTFAAYAGISETMQYDITMATVQFIVYADGTEKARSEIIGLTDEAVLLTADVTDAKVLRLAITNGGDGISGDWGTFAGAVIAKTNQIDEIFATPVPTQTPAATQTPAKVPESTSPAAVKTASPASEDSRNDADAGLPAWAIGLIIAAILAAAAVIILVVIKKKKSS